jgi:hypothetical protein
MNSDARGAQLIQPNPAGTSLSLKLFVASIELTV